MERSKLKITLEFRLVFLGAPMVKRGTGQLLYNATVRILEEWDVMGNIVGTYWNTTSSNIDVHEGAAMYFEDQHGKSLLW
jgi:hypothetical protein